MPHHPLLGGAMLLVAIVTLAMLVRHPPHDPAAAPLA